MVTLSMYNPLLGYRQYVVSSFDSGYTARNNSYNSYYGTAYSATTTAYPNYYTDRLPELIIDFPDSSFINDLERLGSDIRMIDKLELSDGKNTFKLENILINRTKIQQLTEDNIVSTVQLYYEKATYKESKRIGFFNNR